MEMNGYSPSGKVIPTEEDMKEQARLAHIGEWFETAFMCRFGPESDCPTPRDALLGSRLRIQIDHPEEGWMNWRRHGRHERPVPYRESEESLRNQ